MIDSKLKPIGMGILAVALWAAIPAFVKLGSTLETLTLLLVLRFAISSLIFTPLLAKIWQKRRGVPWKFFLLLAVCLGANFYFQGLAMIKLPVSWYLIIFALSPVFTLPFLGVRLSSRAVLGIALAMAGTLLFVDLQEVRGNFGFLPLLFVALGMLTWVAYTIVIRKFHSTYSNLECTALTQFSAFAACLVIWLGHGLPVAELGVENQVSILLLGLLTPLAYFCFNTCLRVLPKFGIVSQYLEPVFGVIIGLVFFHESLTLIQVIGSALIVIGAAATES